MKSLLGALIVFSSISAQAGSNADQAIQALNGPNCINSLVRTLKGYARPSWTQTWLTAGAVDVQAYFVRDTITHNMNVYSNVIQGMKSNLKAGRSNAHYNSWVSTTIRKHQQSALNDIRKGKDVDLARLELGVANCINNNITYDNMAGLNQASAVISSIQGAVK